MTIAEGVLELTSLALDLVIQNYEHLLQSMRL